jgi:hypothetical protein
MSAIPPANPITRECIDEIEAQHWEVVRKWLHTNAETAKASLMNQLKTDTQLSVYIPLNDNEISSVRRMLSSRNRMDGLMQMVRDVVMDYKVDSMGIAELLNPSDSLIIKFNLA